ncbi:MAG: hypothetical protein HXY43_13030 [Fischerella sp.]|uniref:hypothetical protein n=1 Tax=Fischerella sp. TaxID=1191 RepID=UPI001836CF77|nr:hypothetical protein [Fischerella sp.]NWF60157.1 hypothetical protein [Fischerella sp.]
MKKFGLLRWFPHPYSWLNALILSLVMTVFVATLKRNNNLWLNLAQWSEKPESVIVWVIFVLLLPIPAIAFLHHFFLSFFISAIPGEKTSKVRGFFPGLISWRESLYGWLVLILSTLTAILVCTPLLPLFQLNYTQIISESGQNYGKIKPIFAIAWLLSAAIFYQIEYSFKYRLVFGSSDSDESNESESINIPVVSYVHNATPQPEVGLTEIQKTKEAPQKKSNFLSFTNKYRKIPKRVFTFILVPLVALWLYSFAKLPEVKQTIPANLSAETVTLSSSKTAPVDKKYNQAINKARRAAKLAKLAQSESEWKVVAKNWEEAIVFMKAVPNTSSNYGMAQEKIRQYQIHQEFAQQSAAARN